MSLHVPIGIDDFRKIREGGFAFVDKSSFIRELIDDPGLEVALFPRPRRFGKSVNLSMLRCFFEKRGEDLSHLFEGLSIWQAGDAYRAHFQRYPVILFNFKDTKGESFDHCLSAIRRKIAVLFDEHRSLLAGGLLSEREARDFCSVLDGTAERAVYEQSLLDLSTYLKRLHGEQVIILIDEYDAPIHTGHACGYSDEILTFMRAFLGATLKTNPSLFRAIVTGILRIAKESLFSDVNNIGVYSLLARRYRACFGFTEPEVTGLLQRAGKLDRLDAVRAWYNGYLFGGEVIYNPWSVLNYLHRGQEMPGPYWLSTSANDLVRELLERYALDLEPVFERLLAGESVEHRLEENVVLEDLRARPSAIWSLLVLAGYLKAEQRSLGDMEGVTYLLSIPNREVRQVYATTFRQWMEVRLRGRGADLDRLTRALLAGDAPLLEEQLQAFVLNLLSYQDPGSVDPESVYQGFVLGLLAVMEPEYLVRSNRESGEGRPDVTIRPREPGKPAAVLELKVARKRGPTPAAALRQGLTQIREHRYDAELLAAGASAVHAFAVAFDGKRVWVKAAARRATPRRKSTPTAPKRATKRVKRRPAR